MKNIAMSVTQCEYPTDISAGLVTDYTLAVTLKRVPISADFPQFLVIR
jgi:hypothetical protein